MDKDEVAAGGKSEPGMVIAVEYYGSAGNGPVFWVTDDKEKQVTALRLDLGNSAASPTALNITLSMAVVYRLWGIGTAWS